MYIPLGHAARIAITYLDQQYYTISRLILFIYLHKSSNSLNVRVSTNLAFF
jgi:hypothetical protein